MSQPAEIGSHRCVIVVNRVEIDSTGIKNGRRWTKYRVHADPYASPGVPAAALPDPIFTFDNLPVGQVDVLLVPFNGGVSWTAKLPKGDKPRAKPRAAKAGESNDSRPVEERLADLERQVKRLTVALEHYIEGDA